MWGRDQEAGDGKRDDGDWDEENTLELRFLKCIQEGGLSLDFWRICWKHKVLVN